jgi:hypothetical protein
MKKAIAHRPVMKLGVISSLLTPAFRRDILEELRSMNDRYHFRCWPVEASVAAVAALLTTEQTLVAKTAADLGLACCLVDCRRLLLRTCYSVTAHGLVGEQSLSMMLH